MGRASNAVVFGFLAISASEAQAERPAMTIRVLNQAQLSSGKMGKMERYVGKALEAIDVDVKWVDCAANVEACKPVRGANEFWLRILAQDAPDVLSGRDLVGFTQRGDTAEDRIQCINIFEPMIERLAERNHIDSHDLLGAAVVHEVGHMYLGANSKAHSKTGIMRGVWTHREYELVSIGELRFSHEQGEEIRSAMNMDRKVDLRRR